MLRTFSAALLCMLALTVSAVSQPKYEKPSDIPVEAFAALPTFSSAQLSPSGKKIGYYISIDGRRHLVIQNLDGSDRAIVPPGKEKTEFLGFYWKTDDMVICVVGVTDRNRYIGMMTSGRIVSFDLTARKMKWLGKPKRSRNNREVTSFNERVVSYLPEDPDHILLQLNFNRDNKQEVYKVNVNSGRRKIVQPGKAGVNNWFVDWNYEIRLGIGYRSKSEKFHVFYKTGEGKWVDLEKTDWAEKHNIIGFAKDSNILYVDGLNDHGTKGLYTLDVSKGEIFEHIFSRPDVDINGPVHHPETDELAGVFYTVNFGRIEYFDKDLSKLQRGLEKALPSKVVTLVGKAREANLYLVHAESDTNPGDYYLYNRTARKLDWITPIRQEIDPALMATTDAVTITMRDETEIKAYLTKPKGIETKNLPTVILPHGGPHARDSQEWNWWAQFYASRGYLVLQPNFRGSDGYGPAFLKAGENQWGGLMQDDVTDSTQWLIKEGMAHPERICIAGASYGGYAALMGILKEKGLYKCAISVNGVANLPKIKSYDKKTRFGAKSWTKKIGLKGMEDKAVSPHHRAEEIDVPVLLISSEDDARVPYQQSVDMHKKLKRLQKNSHYVKLENGTHHMRTAESRLITLRETEKFLAKHIGD